MKLFDTFRYSFIVYCLACLTIMHFIGIESDGLFILMKAFIVFAFVNFIFALGSYVCFFELLVLMGSVQWFGANIWLTENIPTLSFRPVEHYYTTIFTFTLLLTIPLLFFKPSALNERTRELIKRVSAIENIDKLGKFFFYSGFVFSFLSSFIGNLATIGQVFYLFAQLGYVSMICFIFSKSKSRNIYITITLVYTILTCIRTTLFWPMIFWSLFFFIVYSVKRRVNFFLKLLLIVLGISIVILIQSFKQQLRAETSFRPDYLEASRSGTFSTFSDLASQRLASLGGADSKKVFFGTFFARVNQGTWDNAVIRTVDQNGNFLNGESIYNAALGAFIPRFIWPDKPKFDNALLSRLLNIKINAFISISILAESYVNFGFGDGCIFMIVYALLLRAFYALIMRWGFRKDPLYFVFFPFLFYTFMRAEVDFVQTIYSIVSSTITLLFLFFILDRLGYIKKTQKPSSSAIPYTINAEQ